jgi:glycosyltransferase involved in cell wall biosynthesis
VKADTPLLLYVGRVAPEKRIELLLYAVQKLKKRSLPAPACDFRVAIVGDGQSRQDLEELSVALGVQDRVLFLGSQPHENIGDWYAIGDIFTLTSPVETQGLVILEAMAAGLPCVTVDGGGACEMVAPDETGIVVHFDPQEYADALEQLLKDPTRSLLMGERGKERARLYSPEAMATGVLEVYEAALRLPRPTAFGNHSPKSPTDIIKRQLKAKARRDRLTRQTPKR